MFCVSWFLPHVRIDSFPVSGDYLCATNKPKLHNSPNTLKCFLFILRIRRRMKNTQKDILTFYNACGLKRNNISKTSYGV